MRFSAVARQFSQSPTAAVGGDRGWGRADQVAADLAKEVAQVKVGEQLYGNGVGRSKKEAEQAAAETAYLELAGD